MEKAIRFNRPMFHTKKETKHLHYTKQREQGWSQPALTASEVEVESLHCCGPKTEAAPHVRCTMQCQKATETWKKNSSFPQVCRWERRIAIAPLFSNIRKTWIRTVGGGESDKEMPWLTKIWCFPDKAIITSFCGPLLTRRQ